MNKIFYKPTKVALYDATDINDGFDIWCESKSCTVKRYKKYVKIGDEKVPIDKYFDDIMRMNMQYANMPYFVFEIEGSILFRDFLYNVQKCAQWATSLRLVQSVLPQDDPKSYPVSEEYKGIPEWEDAYYKWFEQVVKNENVDQTRIIMPYSMHSKYWYGCNLKTLINLLSLMKNKFPFFYIWYGVDFEKSIESIYKIDISKYYVPWVDCGLQKYFTSDETDSTEPPFAESCEKVGDYYFIKQDMSLILYSQFVRQSDTDVSGLWDLLQHDDPDKFAHKVFTGDTLIHTTYLAHKSRVYQTVKNRTCFFSQSDGDENDPHYWSKFLSIFIRDMNAEEFKSVIPCAGCPEKCKFKDDVKFRDTGQQRGYIPCPILNKNLDYAKARLEQCDNKLNNLYLDLTKELVG